VREIVAESSPASYSLSYSTEPANRPCPCGSGQRVIECCGRDGMPLATAAGRPADEILPLIRELHAAGRAEDALRQLRSLHALAPQHVPTLEFLASILRAAQPEAAVEPLQELTALEPRNHNRHADLAGLYYQLRRLPEAETSARQALALNPLNPQAHNLLGMIFADIHQPEDAEFHYRQVLLLHEPLAPICANLANVLKSMGRLDEAEAFFRQALYLDPDNVDGLISWVRMEEARNRLPRAWELMERIPARLREQPLVYITRSAVHRRGKRHEQALAELVAVERRYPNAARAPMYYYERGDVLDAMGRYDEAFASYQKANQAVRVSGSREYQAAYFQDLVPRLKRFFARDRIAALRTAAEIPPLPAEMPSPIFIVGFPRSGTTMIEQMLSAHPSISAGDELPYVWRWTQLASHFCGSPQPYPECLANLAQEGQRRSLVKFRSFYITNVELRRIVERGKHRFTDKMPLNETHLGLIHLAFPEAPIVHLIRHPLDVVLSTFFNDLSHGGNCSYDLVTAAQHYALIFELVSHYRGELDLKDLAVRYEDVVDEPEPNLRKLLDFVGEPWDARCLDFQENVRYARTASYAQVKEKLYTRSRFRYRNYRSHVEPIIPILKPAIESLGYSVE
jgi:tetratricopeptide (TPR) repeat protein